MCQQIVRVTIWNEFRHEKSDEKVKSIYPKGMHQAIADGLNKLGGFKTTLASLDEPEHGLSEAVLQKTDTLIWWAHLAHHEVQDKVVERVHQHVLSGMGIIILHSGHFSKIFCKLLGTNCSLKWREANEKERVWNLAPGHEITQGIGESILIPHTEMYGERFDIPEPDKLIFISWYEGGDVFRSGCTWDKGNGRLFYFSPGHETFPIYHQPEIIRVIGNAARWAAPRIRQSTAECAHIEKSLEKIAG